ICCERAGLESERDRFHGSAAAFVQLSATALVGWTLAKIVQLSNVSADLCPWRRSLVPAGDFAVAESRPRFGIRNHSIDRDDGKQCVERGLVCSHLGSRS